MKLPDKIDREFLEKKIGQEEVRSDIMSMRVIMILIEQYNELIEYLEERDEK